MDVTILTEAGVRDAEAPARSPSATSPVHRGVQDTAIALHAHRVATARGVGATIGN